MNNYKFRHHPDGIIFINDSLECSLECSLEEWLQMEPSYTLPEFFVGREYDGERKVQRLYTLDNEIFIREEWADGERYISNLDNYMAMLEDIRQEPEPELISA